MTISQYNINKLRQTPLHYAAKIGNEDMIELLLSKGANSLHRDAVGRTPIELANEYGNNDAMIQIKKYKH
jgi:ankyrin repeat protein